MEIVCDHKMSKNLIDLSNSIMMFCKQKFNLDDSISVWVECDDKMFDETNNIAILQCDDGHDQPNDYTITIDPTVNKRTFLVALAHEMVHIKQYAVRELWKNEEDPGNLVYWKGEQYDYDKDDYYELPWEIEAHGREHGLFVRWCEANNINEEWAYETV